MTIELIYWERLEGYRYRFEKRKKELLKAPPAFLHRGFSKFFKSLLDPADDFFYKLEGLLDLGSLGAVQEGLKAIYREIHILNRRKIFWQPKNLLSIQDDGARARLLVSLLERVSKAPCLLRCTEIDSREPVFRLESKSWEVYVQAEKESGIVTLSWKSKVYPSVQMTAKAVLKISHVGIASAVEKYLQVYDLAEVYAVKEKGSFALQGEVPLIWPSNYPIDRFWRLRKYLPIYIFGRYNSLETFGEDKALRILSTIKDFIRPLIREMAGASISTELLGQWQ